jgi:hypothetical protein
VAVMAKALKTAIGSRSKILTKGIRAKYEHSHACM